MMGNATRICRKSMITGLSLMIMASVLMSADAPSVWQICCGEETRGAM